MNLAEKVKNAGVVGAGGAGFPTHVKLTAAVEWYLANGAECEPLLHKDRELMLHFAAEIAEGLRLASTAVGAKKVVVGVKAKNRSAIDSLKKANTHNLFQIQEFGDYYPAGDEYELVHGITGRLIPPGGIPLEIGAVVNNIETLLNIYHASQDLPVTDTWLTIAGAVKNPVTLKVPVGSILEEVLALAGGSQSDDFSVMEGGLLMGKLVTDLKKPVTKTTGGLIVLPSQHPLIQRYRLPAKQKDRIGHSACDQCSYCTELCPRYLLGYDVQPHLVMRSLGFSETGSALWNKHALLCCGCGLCTLFSCPEMLYPREACERGIEELRALGQGKWDGPKTVAVHPMKEFRRIPLKQLMKRIGVFDYEAHATYQDIAFEPARVQILLKQHIGAPATPVVRVGQHVQQGQLIGDIPPDKLGAKIHASIMGHVREVNAQAITIVRS